jgi:hypothetical protein
MVELDKLIGWIGFDGQTVDWFIEFVGLIEFVGFIIG